MVAAGEIGEILDGGVVVEPVGPAVPIEAVAAEAVLLAPEECSGCCGCECCCCAFCGCDCCCCAAYCCMTGPPLTSVAAMDDKEEDEEEVETTEAGRGCWCCCG